MCIRDRFLEKTKNSHTGPGLGTKASLEIPTAHTAAFALEHGIQHSQWSKVKSSNFFQRGALTYFVISIFL